VSGSSLLIAIYFTLRAIEVERAINVFGRLWLLTVASILNLT